VYLSPVGFFSFCGYLASCERVNTGVMETLAFVGSLPYPWLLWLIAFALLGYVAHFGALLVASLRKRPLLYLAHALSIIAIVVGGYLGLRWAVLQAIAHLPDASSLPDASLLPTTTFLAPSNSALFAFLASAVFGALCFALGFGIRSTGVMTRAPKVLKSSPQPSSTNAATLRELATLIRATLGPAATSEPPSTNNATAPTPAPTTPVNGTPEAMNVPEALKSLATALEAIMTILTTLPSAYQVSDCLGALEDRVDTLTASVQDLTYQQLQPHPTIQVTPPQPPTTASTTASPTANPPIIAPLTPACSDPIPRTEEEEDLPQSYAKVAEAAGKGLKKVKKAPGPRPLGAAERSPAAEDLLQTFAGQSEAEILDALRKREAERRKAAAPPEFLTDEEKGMTMDQLFRKWKIERQQQRNEQETLRYTDFEPLGTLTDEQKLLSRRDVARLVNARKNEVWAKAMKARGVEVIECPVCHRLHTGEHQCIATRWTTEGTKNAPVSRNLVISSTPQGVRVKPTTVIDTEKVKAEYERLKAIKEFCESRAKLASPSTPLPVEDGPQDIPMTNVAHATRRNSDPPPCV
jgi:hypothetical protein